MTAEPSVPETVFPDDAGMVVGIDGSTGSGHALRWAAARTGQFGPIRPVMTWHYPWWAASSPSPPPMIDFEAEARRNAEELIRPARADGVLDPIVSQGRPGPTLVEIGSSARLIVVGNRGHNALTDALLGSVSAHVVAHATVPVAVVPASAPIDFPHQRVVVGADGSDESIDGLRWALAETPSTEVVEVIHSWRYPTAAQAAMPATDYPTHEKMARQVLEETIDRALADLAPRVAEGWRNRIESRVEFGDPRAILAEAARSADLLVLGARGRGGLAHLLLGSVTTALLHRPVTATVVVPHRKD